jgi:hypothetical protein
MGSRESKRDQGVEREAERYREAANLALDQLDWCIDYLYRVKKADIARTIARNRKQIVARIR